MVKETLSTSVASSGEEKQRLIFIKETIKYLEKKKEEKTRGRDEDRAKNSIVLAHLFHDSATND